MSNDPKPNARGGSREGAGRKRFESEPQKRRNISLSDSLANRAFDIGGGNMSAGIRKALKGHGISVALFTTPSWDQLLKLYESFGVENHEIRCQKVGGVWHGQVYKVE